MKFLASRRICNPALKNVLSYLGFADLQSAAKEYAFPFIGGLQIPPVFIGRTFFYGGFQIRRDIWWVYPGLGLLPFQGVLLLWLLFQFLLQSERFKLNL